MEMKVIKCPNCGANAKNHTNCEYCGSLLVRFVDKGIEIKDTSYIDNSMVFPGLLEELKKNVEYQKERRDDATTSILFQDKLGDQIGYYSGMHIINMKDGSEPNLSVGYTLIDGPCSKVKNIHDLIITRLSLLKSFPLFEKKVWTDEDDFLYREYYLNMGQDAEGAARLISEILIRVQEISINEPVFAYTYYDDEEDGDGYDKVFADWCRKNGLPVEGEPTNENSENVDDESDYSEDQEDNSIESLSNWQKVLLAISSLFVVVGSYYYVTDFNIGRGGINLVLFLLILGAVFSITLALLPSKHYPAIIETGLLYKDVFDENPYSEAFKEDVASYKKIVTIAGLIFSCIIFIFSSPILTFSDDNQKQEQVEAIGSQSSENNNPQKSKLEEIKELGYNDGVKFGYSDGGEALRYYVQMGKTLDQGLDHIQSVIARTAYKEDYGDNISESLLDEYCKQFIEGYKSIVIKK